MKRNVATETTAVRTGSTSLSSHQALSYNLISPHTIRRIAQRFTDGAKKYGSVQWRQGINDAEYVADRFNHLFEHLMLFMQEGNKNDDNLGAMGWGVSCLMEVERLAPEALRNVVGSTDLFGHSATEFHALEMAQREARDAELIKAVDAVLWPAAKRREAKRANTR